MRPGPAAGENTEAMRLGKNGETPSSNCCVHPSIPRQMTASQPGALSNGTELTANCLNKLLVFWPGGSSRSPKVRPAYNRFFRMQDKSVKDPKEFFPSTRNVPLRWSLCFFWAGVFYKDAAPTALRSARGKVHRRWVDGNSLWRPLTRGIFMRWFSALEAGPSQFEVSGSKFKVGQVE